MEPLLYALSCITHSRCGLDHFPFGKGEVCHEFCCVLQDQLILYRVKKEREGGRGGRKEIEGGRRETEEGEGGRTRMEEGDKGRKEREEGDRGRKDRGEKGLRGQWGYGERMKYIRI